MIAAPVHAERFDFKIGVVMVEARWADSASESGAAIQIGQRNGKTYFITAKHVVFRKPTGDEPCCSQGAKTITVSFPGMPGSDTQVDLVMPDDHFDLAVLAVDLPQSLPKPLVTSTGETKWLSPGQPLVTIGRTGDRLWDERRTKLERATADALFLPAAAAGRGFSGGPVFDAARGTLVGMITGGGSEAAQAIGIETITRELAEHGIPSALRPGRYQVPEVFIPAGEVRLHGKLRTVSAFYMDRDEVSVAQWRQFLAETPYDYRAVSAACTFNKPDSDALPINCVTWEDAAAFARWAGKALPGEAEWLRAASQDRDRGKAFGKPRSMFDGPPPIGTEPDDVSDFGVRAVNGSLSEWTADWRNEDTWSVAEAPPATGTRRVLCGSSYIDPPAERRASLPSEDLPTAGRSREDYGFRLMTRPPPD